MALTLAYLPCRHPASGGLSDCSSVLGPLLPHTFGHRIQHAFRGGCGSQWRVRAPSSLFLFGGCLQDLIIFPDDCEFKRVPQCPSGRVYVLKFKAGSKRLFFWMQVRKLCVCRSFLAGVESG